MIHDALPVLLPLVLYYRKLFASYNGEKESFVLRKIRIPLQENNAILLALLESLDVYPSSNSSFSIWINAFEWNSTSYALRKRAVKSFLLVPLSRVVLFVCVCVFFSSLGPYLAAITTGKCSWARTFIDPHQLFHIPSCKTIERSLILQSGCKRRSIAGDIACN